MNGPLLLARWSKRGGSPLGRARFSRALGAAVPYSGTIRPHVLEFEPGRARVLIKDRRRIRNHLGSIHAIALVNLGELTSGLALLASLPPSMRGIVRGLSVEYKQKARGTLIAICNCGPGPEDGTHDTEVIAHIHDAEGDEVATVRVDWRIGPVKKNRQQPSATP